MAQLQDMRGVKMMPLTSTTATRDERVEQRAVQARTTVPGTTRRSTNEDSEHRV